jgi:hypothetical protein
MGQSVGTEDGLSYDYIEVQPFAGGETRTVFFDISAFYR